MSAVVLSDDLVAEIAREIHERAIRFPNSVAGDVLPERFNAVAAGVASLIDLEFPDRDAAIWAALGKWKHNHGGDFIRRRQHPNRVRDWSPFP
jgi:hypothetical protein